MNNNIEDFQNNNYYCHRRMGISHHIKKKNNRILDIGCAAGNFGAFLKEQNIASEVVGVELDSNAAKEARKKLDSVFCADLNQTSMRTLIDSNKLKNFDYVVCADVLEHLVDPWSTLNSLVDTIVTDGKVIASIPNVRHWSVWLPLIFKGKWEYENEGIMDRTHLRFFTKHSMLELFDSAGLIVEEVHPLIGGKWKILNKLFFNKLTDFLAIQLVLVGTRKATAQN